MTASTILLRLHAQGVRVEAHDGRLRVDAPAGAVTPELKAELVAEKPALILLLATPRKAAYKTWEAAVNGVANDWGDHAEASRLGGRQPGWLNDDELAAEVKAAILATVDAETLVKALEAIEGWQAAWIAAIEAAPAKAPQAPSGGLADKVSREMIDECEGRRPPRNAPVHAMLHEGHSRLPRPPSTKSKEDQGP